MKHDTANETEYSMLLPIFPLVVFSFASKKKKKTFGQSEAETR